MASCKEEAGLEQEFVHIYFEKPQPTIRDYKKVMGFSNEEEAEFRKRVCEKKGWIGPQSEDGRCKQYTEVAWEDDSESPSIYLAWLRTLLPKAGQVKLISRKTIQTWNKTAEQMNAPYEEIVVKYGGKKLVFHTHKNEALKANLGQMHLVEIEGVDVDDEFQKYLEQLDPSQY